MKEVLYTRPRKYIHCSSQEPTEPGYINILELAESVCRYDLDDMDIFWLQELNEELTEMGNSQHILVFKAAVNFCWLNCSLLRGFLKIFEHWMEMLTKMR